MRKSVCNLAERLARGRPEDCTRFRLVAVIAQGSRIVTYAFNSHKPPGTFPASTHAEDAAVRKVQFKEVLEGCDLYVVRVLASGHTAMAKPCKACQAIILNSGIDTVHYTGIDGSWLSMELLRE